MKFEVHDTEKMKWPKSEKNLNLGIRCKKIEIFDIILETLLCLIFSNFLHDYRGQHCATCGLGVGFHKNIIQGFAGDEVSKNQFFF